MSQKDNVLITLIQIAVGVFITLNGCLIYYFVFNKLIWQILINDRITHGFWVGLFLLISITLSYGLIIVCVAEGTRHVGRHFGYHIPFKPVCSGAFLGAPAIVGLLALRNVPWDIFGTQNIILTIILPIFKTIAFLLSLPIKAWLMLGLPVLMLYVLAVPIGAILGYRLSDIDNIEVNAQET